MNKKNKKNVKTLASNIIKKNAGMIHVKDSAMIPYYINNSQYMVELGYMDNAYLHCVYGKSDSYEADFKKVKFKQLEFARGRGANYLFSSNVYQGESLVSVLTPFAIIAEDEIDFLVQNYYKDVPEEVSKAAEELGITIFDKHYDAYIRGDNRDLRKIFGSGTRKSFEFLNFAFTLPYEEQNIDMNKWAISNGHRANYIEILTKEYAGGKHFKEYFK